MFLKLSLHGVLIFFPLDNPQAQWDFDKCKRAETALKESKQSLRALVEKWARMSEREWTRVYISNTLRLFRRRSGLQAWVQLKGKE